MLVYRYLSKTTPTSIVNQPLLGVSHRVVRFYDSKQLINSAREIDFI